MSDKHPGGRPREVENPVRVSVRLAAPVYDRLDRLAREAGTTVPAVIRQAVSVLKTSPSGKPSAQ